MSEHDEGYGGNADPILEFKSDFTNALRNGSAPVDQPWGMNVHNAHRSEGPLMNSGAGRPGQPLMGQRSIFGTGRGPVFAQVPAYTPVTRAPDPREQPQPPQPDFGIYARQGGGETDPRANQPGVPGFSNPDGAPQSYPSLNNDHSAPHDYSTPAYPNPAYSTPNYPSSTYPAQSYPTEQKPRLQAQPNQTYPAKSYPPQAQPQPNRTGPSQAAPSQPSPNRGYPSEAYQSQVAPSRAYRDAGFPEPGYPAASLPNGLANSVFTDASFPDAGFPGASFPDASFPDANFADETQSAQAPYGEHDPLDLDGPADSYGTEQDYAPHEDQAVHDYVTQASQESAPAGQGRGIPPHQALQAFDAPYDQPPQIPLGSTQHARGSTQGFYEDEHVDADFLDEGQLAQPARKAGMKGRSMFMAGSALLGVVALGGALAFAYKQSGGAMSGAQPPLVQADSRPVKEPPQQPGGKDFPHKNKLIYERLQNGDQPEADNVVPRQEEPAMPTMPGANPTAGMPPQAAVAPAAPPTVATVDDPNAADGGPRRVKTLVVRPDGSVMPPAAPPAAEAAPPAMAQVAAADAAPPAPAPQLASAEPAMPPPPMPQAQPAPAPVAAPAPRPAAAPVAADPQPVAAIPAAKPKPKPVAVADAAPQAAASSKYVVQVGSKQNQTEALATFADMQQKYPTLLANYRPMVQKADLGAKGVWYRLRIGPIVDKSAATKLCGQLKSQGLPDCLVMAAQ